MPLTHYIHCTHCIFYCVPCDPCIISSRTSPTFVLLKMSPSVGESKHTSMTRPLVLGVKEVSNGVTSAEELYTDNGYNYYTNQGISQ